MSFELQLNLSRKATARSGLNFEVVAQEGLTEYH